MFAKQSLVIVLFGLFLAGCAVERSGLSQSPVASARDFIRGNEKCESREMVDWLERQNQITSSYLNSTSLLPRIEKRLEQLGNFEKFGIPSRYGDRIFYQRSSGFKGRDHICFQAPSSGESKVVLGPETLPENQGQLKGCAVSGNGGLIAYGLHLQDSPWIKWRIRNVDTGEDLEDVVTKASFSNVTWDSEDRGIFYGKFVKGRYNKESRLELYHHLIGSAQENDRLVFDCPFQNEWGLGSRLTDNGRHLVITIYDNSWEKNKVLIKDLSCPDRDAIELIGEFDARFSFIGSKGSVFWFFTDLNAPRGRVLAMNIDKPNGVNRWTVIPEAKEGLREARFVQDLLIASYLKDGCSQVKVFDTKGRFLQDVQVPGPGLADGFSTRGRDGEVFYRFTGYGDPGTIYHLDVISGEQSIYLRANLDFDPDDYVTRQVSCITENGRKVCMFISHKKGLILDRSNPTMLVGYESPQGWATPCFSFT